MNEMKAQGLVGAAVAIAKNGTILYSQGYGYANLATCQPVQPSMDFQIGSVTKQFTAAAVLQLQNAGKLNIDNTVLTYLPGYTFDPRLTLRMLLTQTSGLPDYLAFLDQRRFRADRPHADRASAADIHARYLLRL